MSITFTSTIKEGEVPNPGYSIVKEQMEMVSKMYVEQLNSYYLMCIKPKPKRMKQENYEKLLKKIIVINNFMK